MGIVSGRRIIFNPEAPSCGVYGAKLVKPSLTFAAPQTYASDFRVGVQKKSAKILTMEAKTVKTNKRTESSQKWRFVWLLWTLISQAWNGLLRHFQCLKSSAGNPLAVEKGPRSIAPKGAELWPFKEGYRVEFLQNWWKSLYVFKHSFLMTGVEFCKNSKT